MLSFSAIEGNFNWLLFHCLDDPINGSFLFCCKWLMIGISRSVRLQINCSVLLEY